MATKILLLNLATAKEAWFDEASALYQEKIGRLADLQIKTLKSKNVERASAAEKLRFEQQRILEELDEKDELWIFDEKGKAPLDSIAFSKDLQKILSSGKSRLVLLIGGAYGIGDGVKKRANRSISLSTLTMNHLVAQSMLMEQLFRALTIWRGIPYHNA